LERGFDERERKDEERGKGYVGMDTTERGRSLLFSIFSRLADVTSCFFFKSRTNGCAVSRPTTHARAQIEGETCYQYQNSLHQRPGRREREMEMQGRGRKWKRTGFHIPHKRTSM
jgi:hypothetical protein